MSHRQTVVHTPTNSLEQSIDFYTRLKFKLVSEKAPTLVTDGQALVEINPDRFARPGIKLYSDDTQSLVDSIRDQTHVVETEQGFLLSDPNGVKVYLANQPFPVNFEPAESSYGLTGKYAGISVESHDVERTVKFWEAIGFHHQCGNLEDGWASFGDESATTVTIMGPAKCPHLFFNPGLTYFNSGKNLEVIEQIRQAGVPIAEEITLFNDQGLVDNIVLQDPGGLGFFVFND